MIDPGMTRTTGPSGRSPSLPPNDPSSLGHGRFEPGTRLGERYRIVGLLGRGGMGEVYRADDLQLGQSVALKFLPERLASNPADLARFRNEVKVARQIAHPNVARIYDIGEADGHVFLSMEYIDGEDLAGVLRRMGRPSQDKAVEIARQLCLGLAAAHDAGILHRDLKPANVMIDGRGRVRITDFGLAGLMDELEGTEQIAGTPAYMAPEQLQGGSVSARSDIYGLGLILYEIFTGKRAFEGSSLAELKQQHVSGSVTSLSSLVRDVDPAVERVVLRCLEGDPQQRPPSVYAVLAALPGGDPLAAAMAAGETPSPELVANAGTTGGLRPAFAISCAAAALLLIGVVMWAGSKDLAVLTESPTRLSLTAEEILEKTGYGDLPRYSGSGFAIRSHVVDAMRNGGKTPPPEEIAAAGGVVSWHRWSPTGIAPTSIHDTGRRVDDPLQAGPRAVTVLLDVEGRLVGLAAIADSSASGEPTIPSESLWDPILEAAHVEASTLRTVPPKTTPPVPTDVTVAWSGFLPGAPGHAAVFQAGAMRGRPVYFDIVTEGGPATELVTGAARKEDETTNSLLMFLFIVPFVLLPIVVSVILTRRNLRLGRADRRGATRLAVFLFVVVLLESVFTSHISEEGVPQFLMNLIAGAPMGHALVHAVTTWFYYMALEPYVRRLWPRVLVSWARLASGRLTDPLVGRDVFLGALLGIAAAALGSVFVKATEPFGWVSGEGVSRLLTSTSLPSLGGMANVIVYSASIGVLQVIIFLVVVFLAQMLTKRLWAALGLVGLIWAVLMAVAGVEAVGGVTAVVLGIVSFVALSFSVFRLGLLSAITMVLVGNVLADMPATLNLSAWYADRMFLALGVVLAILAYGFWVALAGQPLFRDVLQEERQTAG